MDIKEIVNLLYTAIDLAADGGPAAFTDEEYSEMHELLKKIKSGQFGWHPASELPMLTDNKSSVTVIAYCKAEQGLYLPIKVSYMKGSGWEYESVKETVEYWCYPPKNN